MAVIPKVFGRIFLWSSYGLLVTRGAGLVWKGRDDVCTEKHVAGVLEFRRVSGGLIFSQGNWAVGPPPDTSLAIRFPRLDGRDILLEVQVRVRGGGWKEERVGGE